VNLRLGSGASPQQGPEAGDVGNVNIMCWPTKLLSVGSAVADRVLTPQILPFAIKLFYVDWVCQ